MKPALRLCLTLLVAATGFGQQQLEKPELPNVINSKLETRSASAGLQPTIDMVLKSQSASAWIAYAAPATAKNRRMCCFDSIDQIERDKKCCHGCRLEARHGAVTFTDQQCDSRTGSDQFYVFGRIEKGRVQRIRAYTPDCRLDAGGLPVVWLTEVNPEQSVRWLASLITDSRQERNTEEGILNAIAAHENAEADAALRRFVAVDQPANRREHAAFWLAEERGRSGFQVLRQLAREDKDSRFREQLTFALSESSEPEGINEIIRMAHNDPAPNVRSQALFWLAQKAGEKASAIISESMENDPDLEVKKRAVFALSELPRDEGVPLLLRVAQTHKNRAIRKEAIFWLGESEDPRALDYLEKLVLGEVKNP